MNITDTLLAWYDRAARELPWRQTSDPYRIWISEVILQQTRVNQGWTYYERFVSRFPDVSALASESEEEVLKIWQGLGYYSRARNLYAGARQVMQQFGGKIPLTYQELIKIKGIGPYTAAAIASIVGNEPVPVLDGNTLRVYSRLFAIQDPVDKASGREQCRMAGEGLMHLGDPGRFNQAVMELGALVCLPRQPKCNECPVREHCRAFAENIQETLPRKEGSVNIREMKIHYLVLLFGNDEGHWLFLKQRVRGIWRHLYDFPELTKEGEAPLSRFSAGENGQLIVSGIAWNFKFVVTLRHQLTHRNILATFYVYAIDGEPGDNVPKEWIRSRLQENGLPEVPVPRLIEKFLKESEFRGLLE